MPLSQYLYLSGSVFFLIVWLLLFLLRKDLRKQMLFASIVVTVIALFSEAFIWTKDWWQPQTITNTVVGVEDLIYGFSVGGMVSVLYEELFRRRHYKDVKLDVGPFVGFMPLVISLSVFFVLFFVFGLHSFFSNIIGYFVGIAIVYSLRRDLIVFSLLTGSLFTLVSMPVYWIAILLDPNIITETWLLHKLSGILFLGIPLEDVIWMYFTGLLIGPAYEFAFGYRTREM